MFTRTCRSKPLSGYSCFPWPCQKMQLVVKPKKCFSWYNIDTLILDSQNYSLFTGSKKIRSDEEYRATLASLGNVHLRPPGGSVMEITPLFNKAVYHLTFGKWVSQDFCVILHVLISHNQKCPRSFETYWLARMQCSYIILLTLCAGKKPLRGIWSGS